MREILFRGRRIDNNKWVYGVPFFIESEEKAFIINNCSTLSFNKNTSFNGVEVLYESVCQYTGLTDKNGVKIFEGDLLEDNYTDDDDNVVESNIAVVWDDITACWSVDNSFFQDGSSKANLVEYIGIENLLIVGNIHDK